ncbi:collagen alpha-1(I) chain-like [Dama dama]|uniref:collagen alpha-1(I) chain-like n=1 Tax=Dama dama TaxID=30532 RepID=UPI002A363E0D|nr:collagen alpha-1(I) chain-like [Dama dama]
MEVTLPKRRGRATLRGVTRGNPSWVKGRRGVRAQGLSVESTGEAGRALGGGPLTLQSVCPVPPMQQVLPKPCQPRASGIRGGLRDPSLGVARAPRRGRLPRSRFTRRPGQGIARVHLRGGEIETSYHRLHPTSARPATPATVPTASRCCPVSGRQQTCVMVPACSPPRAGALGRVCGGATRGGGSPPAQQDPATPGADLQGSPGPGTVTPLNSLGLPAQLPAGLSSSLPHGPGRVARRLVRSPPVGLRLSPTPTPRAPLGFPTGEDSAWGPPGPAGNTELFVSDGCLSFPAPGSCPLAKYRSPGGRAALYAPRETGLAPPAQLCARPRESRLLGAARRFSSLGSGGSLAHSGPVLQVLRPCPGPGAGSQRSPPSPRPQTDSHFSSLPGAPRGGQSESGPSLEGRRGPPSAHPSGRAGAQ